MQLEDLGVEPDEERTGQYYRTWVVENVSIAELDDARIFTEEAEEIREDFISKLRDHPRVNATVDLVSMDEPLGSRLLDTVEQAVEEGRELGLERYALVSDDIKKYSMQQRVDVEGVETLATEDPQEALEWAMEDE